MTIRYRLTAPIIRSFTITLAAVSALIALLALPNILITHLLAGGLLALLIPGASVVRLLPRSGVLRSGYERLGWSILGSFVLFGAAIFCLIIGTGGALDISRTVALFTASLISLATALTSSVLKPLSAPPLLRQPSSAEAGNALPFLFLCACACIPLIYNPIAQDNDGFLAKALAFIQGAPTSPSDLRPVFPAVMAALSHLTDLSVFATFPLLPLVLFSAGAGCFWGFVLREVKTPAFRTAALFTLLGAPVIITEMAIIRPQVIPLAFILPLLTLGIEAKRSRSVPMILSGLVMSTVLVPFHELSTTLSLIFILLLAIVGVDAVRSGILTPRRMLIGALFIVPYLLLLPLGSIFSQTLGLIRFSLRSVDHLAWNWWFIDSYKSVDGAQLGWPGLQALTYYLYNGLILYVVLLLALFLTRKRSKGRVTAWVAPLTFLSIFFFLAEIAPRFGFYFLLNRAWPYIALAACVCAVPLLSRIEAERANRRALWLAAFGLTALVGLIGTVSVARDTVVQVFPEERGAIAFLKNLPGKNLVLSSQDNLTLVSLYGGQYYDNPGNNAADEASLLELIRQLRIDITLDQKTVYASRVSVTSINGVTKNVTESKPELVSLEEVPSGNPDFEGAYYLYSYRKATGRAAERYKAYNDDPSRGDLPPLIASYPVAYSDADTVIYRLPNPR